MAKGRLDLQPFQFLKLGQLGVSLEDARNSVQFLNGNNRYSGARAIGEALVAARTVWSIAGWIIKAPVVLSFAELVYLLIAKNRHRLPGGTPACELKPKS